LFDKNYQKYFAQEPKKSALSGKSYFTEVHQPMYELAICPDQA
jgi:hypothetical protein